MNISTYSSTPGPTPGAGLGNSLVDHQRHPLGPALAARLAPGTGIPTGSAEEHVPAHRSLSTALFSSKTDEWATPQEFFDELNREFHFDLDVSALPSNAKCERYYTPEDDGLKQPWFGTVWCNPPYGHTVGKWVRRAAEAAAEGSTVVLLLPARTDTRWFHDYIYQKPGVEVRFIKGRLKFGDSKNAAPFPSLVAVFRSEGNTVKKNMEEI